MAAKSGSSAWKPLLIICGSAILLGAIVMAVGGGEAKRNAGSSGGYSEAEIQEGVISTCQDDIRRDLRDPDSAQFSEWKAWPAPKSTPPLGLEFHESAGDKYYAGAGLVNAANGFGGLSGKQPYACSAVVTTAGKVRAQANPLEDLQPPPTFRQPG